MCFSATVSFATGTQLLPIGAYTLHQASVTDKRYYPLAAFPMLFGLQQLIDSSQVSPEIIRHSISYRTTLFTDELISRELNCTAYTLVVAIPLLISSLQSVRLYGLLILISVSISALFFHYAFTSVWCLFAALLSTYTLRLLHQLPSPNQTVISNSFPPPISQTISALWITDFSHPLPRWFILER